jgi:2-iminobutanoate/2-iminopropanoate deaminase
MGNAGRSSAAPSWAGIVLSDDARRELSQFGHGGAGDPDAGPERLPKQAISAPQVLNEAFAYPRPSSFSRGMRVALPGATMLFLSGTASIDEAGRTLYAGDFVAQLLRTYRNLTELLRAERAGWRDVVRTTCYLRDIERDYELFNRTRTAFLAGAGCDPLPASTAIQAHLCRSDLLVEIEAIALLPAGR